MICKVDPNNIGILRLVGSLFLLCVFISIVSGKTYCKRIIMRNGNPLYFWMIVILYFLLGMMMFMGTYLCQ